ncbi:MAG: hypothetical protein LH609_01010 [Rudanella sp.]|nr:hypothetical protein [Rudanella sp.]
MRYSYALILGALFFFLLYKFLRFDALGYSFNDMYAFLQMSSSWMDGRPFMYDNIWGYHHRIHNYYTVLLWGPLCYTLGAKGVFIAQTTLLLLAYWLTNRHLIRQSVPAQTRTALLLVVLLSPIPFWLNDHPNIGWHTELTYLPAALFWAVGLGGEGRGRFNWSVKGEGRGRFWVVMAGLFLVLVREEGAVLALLIHASAVALRNGRQSDRESSRVNPLVGLLKNARFWAVVIGWSVVFLAGMIWLAAKNNSPDPRLQNALKQIVAHADEWVFWQQMLLLLLKSLLLLVPVAALLFGLSRSLQARSRMLIWGSWLTGILVLTIINMVQSAHYTGQPLFYLVSLTWPPRFVLLWGFSAAFLVLVVTTFKTSIGLVPARTAWRTVAFLWLLQLPILSLARPDLPGWAEWKAAFWGPPGAGMNPQFLDPDDLKNLRAIADQLPPRSNVFAFDQVMPYFHRHYGIWPTGNQWQPADIAVLSRPDFQHLRPRLNTLLPGPIDSLQLKNYTVYYRPDFGRFVRPQRAK